MGKGRNFSFPQPFPRQNPFLFFAILFPRVLPELSLHALMNDARRRFGTTRRAGTPLGITEGKWGVEIREMTAGGGVLENVFELS